MGRVPKSPLELEMVPRDASCDRLLATRVVLQTSCRLTGSRDEGEQMVRSSP
jgi:hypothetical protein